MNTKAKPTKPKFKKCKVCPKKFEVWSSTTQVCSPQCAIEFARVKAAKKEKKQQQQNRADLLAFNRRDLRWQHKKTQPVFNRMRVLEELKWFADRDMEPTCISCQKPLGGDQWCCGHNKTSGGNSRITYDPKNTFLQHNRSCNMGKSGDIDGYKKGLVLRFGAEGDDIIAYCEENRHAKKWEWEELEEMRKGFNQRIRELEQDNV